MEDLQKYREDIDEIQSQLARLFQARLQISHKIWTLKKQAQVDYIDPLREQEIAGQIRDLSKIGVTAAEQEALHQFLHMTFQCSKKFLRDQFHEKK
jgi:chorismate mutase